MTRPGTRVALADEYAAELNTPEACTLADALAFERNSARCAVLWDALLAGGALPPGVRLVDGVPHYSAAWLDEVAS